MHYYQFNIGDYAKATRHLTNEEDLAYRRLIELYYDTEKPLISDVSKLSRLINMRENCAEIEVVLEDFFINSEEGYTQNRIEREIASYHAKADSARANGKKGGRPKKANANPVETEGKPKITQSVNLANPKESGSKANQEPLTINHKPIKVPYQLIVDAYHTCLPELRAVKKITDKRKRLIKRLFDDDEKNKKIEWWYNYFNFIKTNDFLMGRTENKNPDHANWKCDFEFLMNVDNFYKAIEGKYK